MPKGLLKELAVKYLILAVEALESSGMSVKYRLFCDHLIDVARQIIFENNSNLSNFLDEIVVTKYYPSYHPLIVSCKKRFPIVPWGHLGCKFIC
jgi:hypothetical protein